jgi:hypothetical protein
MSEKGFFRHYRLTDEDTIFPQGGATVYYVKQENCDWHEEDTNCEACAEPTYFVGASFCSLSDNFKRSTGRAIAEGRFIQNHEAFIAIDRDALNDALLRFVQDKFYRIQSRQGRIYEGDLK